LPTPFHLLNSMKLIKHITSLLKKIQISLIEKGAYFLTEAIIIIVSITISLWVNNWSEDNKNEEIAQNFLKSISRDLTHDLLEMKEDSASISRQLQCATFIRTLVIPKLPKIV
jgi:GTP-sensing pleiotropic transcriptional regulator CodY